MPTEIAKFTVPRISDSEVISRWKEVGADLGVELSKSVILSPYFTIDGIDSSRATSIESDLVRGILQQSGFVFSTFKLPLLNDFHLHYTHQTNSPEKTYDLLIVQADGKIDPVLAAKIVRCARTRFRTFDNESIHSHLDDVQRRQVEARSNEINHLGEIVREFLTSTKQALTEGEQSVAKRIKELENAADLQRQKDAQAVADERQRLADERHKLEETQKQFDSREPRNVRRDIRDKVLAELKERRGRFRLSWNSSARFFGVFGCYVVFLAVLGALIWYFAPPTHAEVSNPEQPSADVRTYEARYWTAVIRQGISGVGFIVTFAFFLRWLNWWFKTHAEKEFHFIRYGDDFTRANWLIEIANEMKVEGADDTYRNYVVQLLSNDLFREQAPDELSTTALESIGKSLKGSSLEIGDLKLNVGKQGKTTKH